MLKKIDKFFQLLPFSEIKKECRLLKRIEEMLQYNSFLMSFNLHVFYHCLQGKVINIIGSLTLVNGSIILWLLKVIYMVGSLTWSMIRNKRGYNPINNNLPLVKTGNNHALKPLENRSNSKG